VTRRDELLPELDPLLRQIFETRPAAATRAGRVLGRLCRPWLERLRTGLPLPRSVLTPGGYPLELTFRSDSTDISYTAEPGLPDDAASAKWRFVQTLAPGFDPDREPLLRTLVAQPGQRFGCWLGIRLRERGTAFKVYQEVVPPAEALVWDHLRRDVPGLEGVTALKPTLVGVSSVESGIAEYYGQVQRPDAAVLHRLFAAAGVSKQLPALLDYVAWLGGREIGTLWSRLRFGVSYKVCRDTVPVVTLFLHGCEVFSGNRHARARMLSLARQFGRKLPAYERATRAFEVCERAEMMHGMVGLRVNSAGGLECSVGLRPFG
jgi:hypothetical protein